MRQPCPYPREFGHLRLMRAFGHLRLVLGLVRPAVGAQPAPLS
jgi:hypothetical protein